MAEKWRIRLTKDTPIAMDGVHSRMYATGEEIAVEESLGRSLCDGSHAIRIDSPRETPEDAATKGDKVAAHGKRPMETPEDKGRRPK